MIPVRACFIRLWQGKFPNFCYQALKVPGRGVISRYSDVSSNMNATGTVLSSNHDPPDSQFAGFQRRTQRRPWALPQSVVLMGKSTATSRIIVGSTQNHVLAWQLKQVWCGSVTDRKPGCSFAPLGSTGNRCGHSASIACGAPVDRTWFGWAL